MQNFRIGNAAAASFFCSLQLLLLLRSMCVHKLNALAHSYSPSASLSLSPLCLTLDRLFRRIIFIFDSALCSQRQRGRQEQQQCNNSCDVGNVFYMLLLLLLLLLLLFCALFRLPLD